MNLYKNVIKIVLNLARVALFALALVSLVLVSCNNASEGEGSGKDPAPEFTVYDRSGDAVHLSDFVGKPVVLNFWATWCAYCIMEMPDFNNAYISYPDVAFLMVNATDGVNETEDKAKNYVDSMGFGFDIYFDTDSSAQNAYRIDAYPMTFFIDRDGGLVFSHRGKISYDALIEGIESIR